MELASTYWSPRHSEAPVLLCPSLLMTDSRLPSLRDARRWVRDEVAAAGMCSGRASDMEIAASEVLSIPEHDSDEIL